MISMILLKQYGLLFMAVVSIEQPRLVSELTNISFLEYRDSQSVCKRTCRALGHDDIIQLNRHYHLFDLALLLIGGSPNYKKKSTKD